MPAAALGLALGLLALALPWNHATFERLPLAAVLLVCAAAPLLLRACASGALLGAFGLGMLWAVFYTGAALDDRVSSCADDDYQALDLEIVSAPTRKVLADAAARSAWAPKPATPPRDADGRVIGRFDGRVLAAATGGPCAVAPGRLLRLSWYDPPLLAVGQRWRATLRVRPPWSYRNPGGFDYERWLLAQGYAGTGYVRDGRLLRHGSKAGSSLRRWLEREGGEHRGLLLALVAGDRSAISLEHWEQFRRTGTVHLMVVSGLHVGLLCAIAVAGTLGLVRLGIFGRYRAPLPAAAVLGLVVAGLFVLSSGAGVPAQRAWLMAALLLLASVLGWRTNAGRAFLLGLVGVLLLDPLAVHGSGTWLSFGAVAALLLTLAGTREARWPITLLRVQLVLLVALTPVLAAGQSSAPGVGALVNLLTVPLLALLLPPLLLAATLHELLPGLAGWLLGISAWLLDLKLLLIGAAARAPLLPAGGLAERWLPLLLVAGYLLLTTTEWRWRLMLLLPWTLWLAPDAASVPAGAFRLTAFDVGQGSALLIETRRHRLLYDAGPAYPGGLDLGAAVLVPALRQAGSGPLDALVLSHGDTDHIGGAASVLEAVGARRLYGSGSVRELDGFAGAPCLRGVGWRWDGVDFRFLHPPLNTTPRTRNDGSCVLRIAAEGAVAVLAGDVSARVEQKLVREQPQDLRADVITAPHHGSGSSGSHRYLAAAAPRWVLISAPRRSRYGHPHPAVLARIEAEGAAYAVTGWRGALRWESWRPERLQGGRDAPAYWVSPPEAGARARRGG